MKKKRTKSTPSKSAKKSSVQELIPIPKPNTQIQTFKFISGDYSLHLKCLICLQLMIRPMRLHPCGHTFCQKCIEYSNSINGKACPIQICSRKYQVLQNDRTAESLIDQLKVACTNDGCVWKGEYDKYKKSHKDACVFKHGGLNVWLSQLTNGIILTQRNSNEFSDCKKDESSSLQSRLISRSQTLQPCIESSLNQQSQKLQINNGNYVIRQQLQKKQVQHINTQQDDPKQYKCSNLIELIKRQQEAKQNSFLNRDNIIQSSLEEKQQQKQQKSNSISSINQSSRPINNSNVFRIPFGPSIQDQINQTQRRNNNLMNKQLKKIQHSGCVNY